MSDNNQNSNQQGSQSANQSGSGSNGHNSDKPNQDPKPQTAPLIPFTRDELQKKSWKGFNKEDG